MDSTATSKEMIEEIKLLREDKEFYMKLVALQNMIIKRINNDRDALIQKILDSTLKYEEELDTLYWKFKGDEALEAATERASTESSILALAWDED